MLRVKKNYVLNQMLGVNSNLSKSIFAILTILISYFDPS